MALIGAVTAALLIPASVPAQAPTAASFDRPCVPPNSPRCRQAERFKDKFQQRGDAQKGITPACRSAADKYSAEIAKSRRLKSGVSGSKAALKKAKSKKAKKKARKKLKKYKKLYKSSAAKTVKLKSGYDTACAGARVKPF